MFSSISSVPFSLSSPSSVPLHIHYSFCRCLTVPGYSGGFLPSFFFFFAFQFWKFPLSCFQAQRRFTRPCPLLISPSEASFTSVSVFMSNIPSGSSSDFPSLCFPGPIWFWTLSALPSRALTVGLRAVLNSWSYTSGISVLSGCGSKACSLSKKCAFMVLGCLVLFVGHGGLG